MLGTILEILAIISTILLAKIEEKKWKIYLCGFICGSTIAFNVALDIYENKMENITNTYIEHIRELHQGN